MSAVRGVLPMVAAAAVAAATAAAAWPSGAVDQTGFAFGRTGGNIRPYSVTIANDGHVHVYGAAQVSRALLNTTQLATLNRVATETRFVAMPKAINCRGSLPDMATTYVRVAARTVRVHGGCLPRYERLLRALKASVALQG